MKLGLSLTNQIKGICCGTMAVNVGCIVTDLSIERLLCVMGCQSDKSVHVVGINFKLVSFLYLLFQIIIINPKRGKYGN